MNKLSQTQSVWQWLSVWMTLICSTSVFAADTHMADTEIMVTSGAGYRALVTDIAKHCQKDYGLNMRVSFGNFGYMLAQIKTTGMIEAAISSQDFFTDNGIDVADVYPIGQGTLVLAWRKGLHLSRPQDLLHSEIERIAIPHTQKALYGKAGLQYLQFAHLEQAVKDKLYVVSTVPQVTSYLLTGEVDAGFVNLTDIDRVKEKIGGYIPITQGYQPIEIVTGILSGHKNEQNIARYKQCMTSKITQKIASAAWIVMSDFNQLLFDETMIFPIILTAKTCLVSMVMLGLFGVMIGYLLAKHKNILTAIIDFFITLPLVFPPIGTGFILLLLLGRNGVMGKMGFHPNLIFTEAGVYLAAFIAGLPFGGQTGAVSDGERCF
ncbi:molybdate ABC transporter substrate-binding protein [Vibrio sp. PP-XX7]